MKAARIGAIAATLLSATVGAATAGLAQPASPPPAAPAYPASTHPGILQFRSQHAEVYGRIAAREPQIAPLLVAVETALVATDKSAAVRDAREALRACNVSNNGLGPRDCALVAQYLYVVAATADDAAGALYGAMHRAELLTSAENPKLFLLDLEVPSIVKFVGDIDNLPDSSPVFEALDDALRVSSMAQRDDIGLTLGLLMAKRASRSAARQAESSNFLIAANSALALGLLSDAENFALYSLRLREKLHGPQSFAAVEALWLYSRVLLARGRNDDVRTIADRGLALTDSATGPQKDFADRFRILKARALAQLGDRDGAVAVMANVPVPQPIKGEEQTSGELFRIGLLSSPDNAAQTEAQYRALHDKQFAALDGRVPAQALIGPALALASTQLDAGKQDEALTTLAVNVGRLWHRDRNAGPGWAETMRDPATARETIREIWADFFHDAPNDANRQAYAMAMIQLGLLHGAPGTNYEYRAAETLYDYLRLRDSSKAAVAELVNGVTASLDVGRMRTAYADYAFAETERSRADPSPRDMRDLGRVNAVLLRARAFETLQRVGDNPAGAALARRTARALVSRDKPAVAALLDRRDAILPEYRELSAAFSRAVGGVSLPAEQQARLAALDRELSDIDAKLTAQAPEYFELVRPSPLNEPDARALLEPDEGVLMVVPGAQGTHLVAITAEGMTWKRAPVAEAALAAQARRLLYFAGAEVGASVGEIARWESEITGNGAFDRKTAAALYQSLVAPVAGALAGKKALYVVTSGALTALPFSILVAAPPQGNDDDPAALRATKWFADDFDLVQLPSLQGLALQRKLAAGRGEAARAFSGWGDPALAGSAQTRGGRKRGVSAPTMRALFATRSGSGTPLADPAAIKSLARLPGTAQELNAMASALSAPRDAIHLDAAATETAVKAADLSGAGILAFATHGVMAGEISGGVEPGLILTPPATATADDDGLLTASEVAGLRLNADWAILSACNTAAGDGGDTPGLSGLARAFLFAGARSLLVSYWPVRDDVASRLTVRAIEIARDNPALTRAAALARAMREIRQDSSTDASATMAHPNAWAPFMLIGDPRRPLP